ncbi:MAG: hypothetical protein U0230_07790 [Polyangiales bacterium]
MRVPLLFAATPLLLAVAVAADDAPSLALEPRAPLFVGDRAELVAVLVLRSTPPARVLLTPSGEGSALSVVRGRLLRSDAEVERDADGREALRFRIPVVADAPGDAFVRVEARVHLCDPGCRSVVLEARAPFRVEPRR